MTANDFTNNTAEFFFVSDLKIVFTNLVTKSFKTVQGKLRRKFNFYDYPQKNQIYRWVHKFQATGSVNNFNKKAENPRSGRKLTTRCPNNVDVVRDSIGRIKKSFLTGTRG